MVTRTEAMGSTRISINISTRGVQAMGYQTAPHQDARPAPSSILSQVPSTARSFNLSSSPHHGDGTGHLRPIVSSSYEEREDSPDDDNSHYSALHSKAREIMSKSLERFPSVQEKDDEEKER